MKVLVDCNIQSMKTQTTCKVQTWGQEHGEHPVDVGVVGLTPCHLKAMKGHINEGHMGDEPVHVFDVHDEIACQI
jgi:hypothetical protein